MEHGAHGVVVSHPLRMRKALGSNPSVSILRLRFATKRGAAATKVPPGTGDLQMLKSLAITSNFHKFKPGRQTFTRAMARRNHEELNAAEKKRIRREGEPMEKDRTSERAPSHRKQQNTHREARTHDHKVKGLALGRLS